MSEGHASRYRPLLSGPMRGGPPEAPPPRIATRKRSVVKRACEDCRQRKAKVLFAIYVMKPKSDELKGPGRDCQYAAFPYELQAAATQRKHDLLEERMVHHEDLYDSLKTRRPEEVEDILRQIQAGKDINHLTLHCRQIQALHLRILWLRILRLTILALPVRKHTIQAVNNGLSVVVLRTPGLPPGQYEHPEYVFEKSWRDTQHRYAEDSMFVDLPGYTLPLSRWTTISDDDRLLSHLLLLFWTWDTICSRVIDRTMFEEDLKAINHPNELRFCSPFLVNALLAVSCLYTTNQATFLLPNDPNTRGQAFAKEAARLLPLEDTSPSLMVAQGLTLMNAYEAVLGNGETALSYQSRIQARYLALRLDSVLRFTDVAIAGARQRREAYALSWISWGFYVWDWKLMHGLCRRFIIKKPNRPKTWHDEATSSLCKKDSPDYWWFPYPMSVVPQKSLKREIFDAECELAEITEQVLEFLIPLEDGVAPRRNVKRAMELYTEIIEWKFSLPERLKAENAVLPAAIVLHLTADLIIISMLRPFDGLSKEEFGPFDPVTTSYAHASNAISAIWHFRALYTLRNEYRMIQASAVCAFRVLFDIQSSPIQLETFVKACQALAELGESFPVAKDVILSIKSVARKQRLRVPSCAQEHLSNQVEDKEDSVTGYTDVKIIDHSVIVEKADPEGHTGHLTSSGLLSSMAPVDIGPD
ncbi:related to pathway-specific regulatory protein nit-4 [Fusarium torulosum]|uniref:Related to pathway-specific regulatory protein nit-4 n=1 Tax=Fusarium torulosum TaxID=33205 RepID=A0AAE8MAK1_9HYPO|nr:related to pathway-specific regulatory protein nit-4 [Fusarium torulosum]